jgi:putative DNA primase/helicase
MPPSTTEFEIDPQYSDEIRSVSAKEPCPLCNGEYQCYTFGDRVGCAGLDEAPSGWERVKQDKNGRWIFAPSGSSPKRASRKQKQKPTAILPNTDHVLPLLLTPRQEDDFPKWEKTEREHGSEYEKQIEYLYPCPETGEPLGKIVRRQWSDRRPFYGKNRDETKDIKPWHWAEPTEAMKADGTKGWWSDRGKGTKKWGLYRQGEIEIEVAAGEEISVLFYIAGEEAVESGRRLGLWAITNQGGEGASIDQIVNFVGSVNPKLFAILGDNDPTGRTTSQKLLKAALKANLPAININPLGIWDSIPEKGDITNVLEESGMSQEEIIRALEEQIRQQISRNTAEPDSCDGASGESSDTPSSFNPKEEFTQFTLDALYGDKPWICVDDKLYHWTGTYYKNSKDAVEIRRLADFCNTYAVPTRGGLTYPYAKPSKVRQALEWVKMRLTIDPDLVNPAGLNCTNGVLQIEWNVLSLNPAPQWRLIEHTPELYYTYEPLATYDPEADSDACDRLLKVLDAPQRDIFLKTTAASLDLATIRQYKGRLVRGLLLKGHGSNGKDTLREAVSMMYGRQGMTGCTLSDFASYDEGRKFPLARLKHSRVNWASENANTTRLDKIQSLKAFITGDTLSAEGKGKDESEFAPTGIAMFNVNDTPKLQGTLEAIASRYGVLSFTKTFKIGADSSKGELEADPRFKYDPNFLRSEVLPAFLNRVLDALQRLMVDGIDYSCTQKALEDIQAENSHLFQFCQDTGLNYEPNSILTAGEIWARLEQWYQDNGTLTYEEGANGKQKAIWTEQALPSDRNIKGANQILGRFQQLFPKCKRVAVPHPNGKKRVQALQGIGFICGGYLPDGECDNTWELPTPVLLEPTPLPPQDPPQKTTENQGFHPTHPSFPTPVKKIENQFCEVGAVDQENQKNSDSPQQLGWVGCDAGESMVSGVDNCGGIGVEIQQTGVGMPAVAIAPEQPIPDNVLVAGTTPATMPEEKTISKSANETEEARASLNGPVEKLADEYTEEDIEEIARILADERLCLTSAALDRLRQCWDAKAMNLAAKRLTVERHAQIKELVIHLNSRQFRVGDRVYWSKCPAHCEEFAPFEITAIDGDYAKLDLIEKPVRLRELRKV